MQKEDFREVKVVVFDLTGTILRRQKEVDTIIQSMIILHACRVYGRPLNKFAPKFWQLYEKTHSASGVLGSLLGISETEAGIVVKLALHEVYRYCHFEMDKQQVKLFRDLSRKYKLAIYSKIFSRTGEAILRQLGIFAYFDFFLFGDLMPQNLQQSLKIIENHFSQLMPANMLVVGDSYKKDYQPVVARGMKAILVKSPHLPRDLLKQKGINFIASLTELRPLLL